MRKSLILYFTLGYPDQETIEEFTELIDPDYVDYVEFGFPSESPVYDGPKIRGTHRQALKNYDAERSDRIFGNLISKGIRIYSLTYYGDIKNDPGRFYQFLSRRGFSGMIVPDLLIDFSSSAKDVISSMKSHGLEYIPFFNPATPDTVIRNISSLATSWIYYGMQPSTGIAVPFEARDVVERIRSLLPDREINFGFGIRGKEQVKDLVEYGASGVAIGTALIDMMSCSDKDGFRSFIDEMRGVLDVSR